ncbi:MAG: radical SAM family heme chaperone HemW [Clostridia bacterium]|nr:radical SAM family heme chaperone HemW [Clostridia bacterium]
MPKGLYIHVPFCNGKCPYCDFYSVSPTDSLLERYTEKICSVLKEKNHLTFDTVYFGGGTPSLLMPERIGRILNDINIKSGAEITVECNPSDTGSESGRFDFEKLAECGVNRISLGLQSGNDRERQFLGRRAGAKDAERAVRRAQSAGITNISLDLMLGISSQTMQSLEESFDLCVSLGAKHVSAYMLKIEPDTPYHNIRGKLSLPDEDEVCDLYLRCCELAEKHSMYQYEISNFAYKGYESRHNLKYWHCEEYLGIGPAAHSFINGKRFYYERSLDGFLGGASPVADGEGGDFEEYAMLALRLSEGLSLSKTNERFGFPVPDSIIKKAQALEKQGLVQINKDSISLTRNGFLLSNAVISRLLLE